MRSRYRTSLSFVGCHTDSEYECSLYHIKILSCVAFEDHQTAVHPVAKKVLVFLFKAWY
ncbi:hypothetical protein IF1G_03858 [Cordyceps javanica]|uniref:Uncharacterized protein n=1 Tax=Cordyceps javanica TaxID=43265 RepID=A0A545V8S5_9HYPO|nr:hypothetical protein IF1G_03858 [Cordyceps javanica]